MSDIKSYKIILFDWDNTLADTLPFIFEAHNHVRSHFGLEPFSEEAFKEASRYSTRDIYPKLYGDQADEAVKTLRAYVENNHLDAISLLDGALDLIKLLHDKGIILGIVSNKRTVFLQREVKKFELDHFFKVIIGAGDANRDKPHADPINLALQKINHTTLDDVLYVGDTESDIISSKEANISMIYIKNGNTVEEERLAYDHIHSKLDSTQQLFLSLK